MNKKRNRKSSIYFGTHILSVLLSVFLILNMAEFAFASQAQLPQLNGWPDSLSENTERIVSENTLKVKAVGINDPQGVRLTELVLTNLAEPAEGEPYDTTATVASRENISWDIPVYWIDSNGRTYDEPTAGQKCLPLIVFFVPDGYATDGLLELTPYLSDLFQQVGGVLSVVDYDRGITYITGNVWELGALKNDVSENNNTLENYDESGESHEPKEPETVEPDEPEQPDAVEPDEPEQPVAVEPDEPEQPDEPDLYTAFAEKYRESGYSRIPWTEELEAFGGIDQIDFVRLIKACGYLETKRITSGLDDTFPLYLENRELVDGLKNARKEVGQALYDQADPFIKAHTSDVDLVVNSDQENLLQFFHMIIDNLMPQAARLLRENFPAFSAADDECFSRELGVDFILPQGMGAAYTDNSYEHTDDFHILVTICLNPYKNISSSKDPYTFGLTENSRNMAFLKQTVVHEMMHVFMADYNRNGESLFENLRKTENGNYFVPGFGEMTRSQKTDLYDTVKYPLWFSEGTAGLCGTIFSLLDSDIKAMRTNEGGAYSTSGLYEFSQRQKLTLDETDSYYMRNDEYNNYIFGALAVMYMGEMYNRKTTGASTVLVDSDGSVSIDTLAVRNGISAIMERMHNGETMDSVFEDISDGKYSTAQDFCEKYFDMDGPNEDTLSYAANVLNYVNALSGEERTLIDASILKPFDESILDLIDLSKADSTDIYVIQDGPGFVKSTVPDEIASKTGGRSDPGEVLGIQEELDVSSEETVSPPADSEAATAEQESEAALVEQESEAAPIGQVSEGNGSEIFADPDEFSSIDPAQCGEAA